MLQVTYLGAGPQDDRWGLPSRQAFALTHLTHAIDFITAAAGAVTDILMVRWAQNPASETVTFSLAAKRCPLITVNATNAAAAFTCTAAAVLEDGGTIQLDSLRNVSLTGNVGHLKRSGSIWRERDLGTEFENGGYRQELADFFSEVRGGHKSRLPDLHQATNALSIVEELLQQRLAPDVIDAGRRVG